jgi:hypothetical protein
MLERVGLTGVSIEYDVSGEAQPLPAGVGLCVPGGAGVADECDQARSGRPGDRVAALRHEQDHGRIRNGGRRSAPPMDRNGQLRGSGKGLVGMYERSMLYGGRLTAGGLPDGGFEVVLTLPIRATAASSVDHGALDGVKADG